MLCQRWRRVVCLRSMAALAEKSYLFPRPFSKPFHKNKNNSFSKADHQKTTFDRVDHRSSNQVNLLLTTWMKDLEKIFYGNCAAYDAAVRPEATKDELPRVIWRNIFSEEDAPMPKGSDAATVQALARYTRRECACLALTGPH